MSVRISGGEWAGRLLLGPPRPAHGRVRAGLRPTAGRLRKALFAVLGEELSGARVLDLCAGVGTLGFEALSRGARHSVFVERHPAMCSRIERNAARLSLSPLALVNADAARALLRFGRSGADFEVVFLDPPWAEWETGGGERLLAEAVRLGPGVVAAEHPSGWEAPLLVEADSRFGRESGRVASVRTRTIAAGDGAFSLYRPESGRGERSMSVP